KQAAPAPQKQEQKQPAKNQGGQRQGKGRQQKQERDALAIPKDERGVFAFTEEELAEDTSLRLIKDKPDGDDTKYASFEDYLKDR
ncbi:hypothetical protein LJC04_03855, partial [Ruminococcaceae bacterium OttesenSCG-928-O06]|nr:hypothetical protein [Ruminococcaceae bacterium OttesenSCG-928-O06]